MPTDPDKAHFSFRHPRTGEWAHDLKHDFSAESWHSYLEPAWPALLARESQEWTVVEVGFGRGFNMAELIRRTAQELPQQKLHLVGLEPQPLALEPWPEPPAAWRAWMPWWGKLPGHWEDTQGRWQLTVSPKPGQDAAAWPARPVDLVLLDLFSPAQHAEAWAAPLFQRCAEAVLPGGLLTTYSCARSVRDGLEEAGFRTQRIRRSGWRDTLLAERVRPSPPRR